MTAPHETTQQELPPALRAAYLRLIEAHAGLRLSDHQAGSLDEIVARLTAGAGQASSADLYTAMTGGGRRDLMDMLAASCTIGETHFFRVAPQIQALRQAVIPEMVGRRAVERRLRLWSAGCSTGEEPYTLAMLLRQHLPAPEGWDIGLLATDINGTALESARQATYGEWSFRGTSDAIRRQYFTSEGTRWRLNDVVRSMVSFVPLNLATDAFPSPGPDGPTLDLILCRNVTIYFSPVAAQRLYRRFAAALVPGGWLILGPSDPTPDGQAGVEPVYAPGAVLWRRPAAAGVVGEPALPASPATQTLHGRGPGDREPAPTEWGAVPPRSPSRGVTPVRPAAAPVARETRPQHARAATTDGGVGAREQAERLVRARPLEADGHVALGMLYLDEGSIDPAIESLRRATFLDEHHPLALFGTGRAYLMRGDVARARVAFGRARRALATLSGDDAVPAGAGMTASELRYAVETQLDSLGEARTT